MHVLIFGGTGFLGRQLTRALTANGYQVTIITRNRQVAASKSESVVELIEWDNAAPLSSAIYDFNAVDTVINLAGGSIGNRRWSDAVKAEIVRSRVNTTRSIVNAINDGVMKPRLFINASAAGYYGPQRDNVITENQGPGQDFLAEVCRKWEDEANKVQNGLTRVVTIRIGIVLGSQGALARMAIPFKFYAGGPLGSGKQWLPWIHIHDLMAMLEFIIEHADITGPVNGTAPNPVNMNAFAKNLAEVLKRPSWLPVPAFLLKIVLGQMAEMLLHGQRAIPEKMLDAGFEFKFPDLRSALEDILWPR